MPRANPLSAMTPCQGDAYLQAHRPGSVKRFGAFVLVVTRPVPESAPSSRTLDYVLLARECHDAFPRRGGVLPEKDRNGALDLVGCAWFPMPARKVAERAVAATAALRSRLQECLPDLCFVATVARDEYAGFRLLADVGDGQVVVDPRLWEALGEDVRDIAKAANIHPPAPAELLGPPGGTGKGHPRRPVIAVPSGETAHT